MLTERRRLDQDLAHVRDLRAHGLLHPMGDVVGLHEPHRGWQPDKHTRLDFAAKPAGPHVAHLGDAGYFFRDGTDRVGHLLVVLVHEARRHVLGGIDADVDDQQGDGEPGDGVGDPQP